MCTHCEVLFVVREVEEGYRGMMLLTPPPHTTYSCTCFGLGGGMGACLKQVCDRTCLRVSECVRDVAHASSPCATLETHVCFCLHVYGFLIRVCVCVCLCVVCSCVPIFQHVCLCTCVCVHMYNTLHNRLDTCTLIVL